MCVFRSSGLVRYEIDVEGCHLVEGNVKAVFEVGDLINLIMLNTDCGAHFNLHARTLYMAAEITTQNEK